MRFLAMLAIGVLLTGTALAESEPPPGSVHLGNGAPMMPQALVSQLRGADVVILGELHDNAAHHLVQAWLVDELSPDAIVFEMIKIADESKIESHLGAGGTAEEIGFAIAWDESGWPDWAMYRPIFKAAGSIAYFGADPGRDSVMSAIRGSAAETVADARFREVLSQPVETSLMAAMEQEMIDAHCGHLPAEMAPSMVEGQRLRDAVFASAVLRARQMSEGPVVLITGNGHARTDRGVPFYLKAVAPDLMVASVGALERAPEDTDVPTDLPYDMFWITAPAEREDPCAALEGHTFGKG